MATAWGAGRVWECETALGGKLSAFLYSYRGRLNEANALLLRSVFGPGVVGSTGREGAE